VQVYEEGPAKCYSCSAAYDYGREHQKSNGQPPQYREDNYRRAHYKGQLTLEDIRVLPSRGFESRRIPKEVAAFYGVKVSYKEDGSIDRYFFPFAEVGGTETVGYKTKNPADKKGTYSLGKVGSIFGLEHFRNGGKRIVITEGEEDALAVASASMKKYNQIYAAVSMGGSDQVDYLVKNRELLRKFEEIVIWFDNDEPGLRASEKAARILGSDKVKVVLSEEKDACDVNKKPDGWKLIMDYVWKANHYSPAGLVIGESTWERYKSFNDLSFLPWPPFLGKLNELTYGRALGTITMLVAGTSTGKSSFLREDIFHLLQTTDVKIGACFLEEDVGETVSSIMGLYLNKRLGLPDTELSEEEERLAWESTVGLPGRTMFLDHQGSVSDNSLIDKLEYMAVSGCTHLYLDHITIAVSDADGENVNTAIDRFMSDLLKIVKRHNVWIGVVSHLRKVRSGEDSFESGAPITEDDIKGSGSLKQISFQTIAISRNKLAENARVRNKTYVYLLKDRKTGNTGPAGAYSWDPVVGRLKSAEKDNDDQFEVITNDNNA